MDKLKTNKMKKEEMIDLWIVNAITKTKNVNKKSNTSYGLKHFCEEAIGLYVSNEEIKAAMLKNGFIADKKDLNWNFNISIIVNKVVFNQKLGNLYSDKHRYFKGKTILI